MSAPEVLAADWTWAGGSFAEGIQVRVGADGRIEAVGAPGAVAALGQARVRRLAGRALLPGMVDVHSHAFQRGLRGHGERFPEGAGSFWSWREAMYGLVERLDAGGFRGLCLQAFREMRAAGITAVGEFHYFHHLDPEAADYRCDDLLIEAAAEAGVRLALLETYYRTGAIGQPLAGGQRRFATPSPEAYWRQMDALAGRLRPSQSLGAAVHSLRAASLDDLAAVYDEARRRDLPFHIHVEEQRREIEEALAYYGKRPMELLLERLGTSTDLTAVHCTHTGPEDFDRFLAAGGRVCLCPTTEGNLGDGIAPLARLAGGHAAGLPLCLGSDSNARISLLEEMRWLEYAQRLATESRGALRDAEGRVAKTLFDAATVEGARALGLETGAIEPGLWADFLALDLGAPTLAGWEPETLLESFVFGAGEEAIAATCVGGEWREND